MKPNLYLAGKIAKDGWRDVLVPRLDNHLWEDGPIETASYIYVGPFFTHSTHDCPYGPSKQGMLENFHARYSRLDVVRLNMAALASANLLFAYIDSGDCYGTIMEIGWAIAKGIRVALVFAPDVNKRDFWFLRLQSDAEYENARPCCLPDLLRREAAIASAQVSTSNSDKGVA